jgi:hypothetical protein
METLKIIDCVIFVLLLSFLLTVLFFNTIQKPFIDSLIVNKITSIGWGIFGILSIIIFYLTQKPL